MRYKCYEFLKGLLQRLPPFAKHRLQEGDDDPRSKLEFVRFGVWGFMQDAALTNTSP